MKIIIKNGRVIDPETNHDDVVNLAIEDNRIVGLGEQQPSWSQADQIIDAQGQWVMPGIIDLAVSLPVQKRKLKSETTAALQAGITHICCQPTNHPLDSTASVNLLKGRLNTACSYIHTDIIGAITQALEGTHLTNMGGLKGYGCIGVTNARKPFASRRILQMAMEYASTYDLTLFLHPVDHELQGNGCVHEGHISTRMGLSGIPIAVETSQLTTLFSLIEQTKAKVHLCRLSSANSVRLLKIARNQGLQVTADVAIHQLFLTEMDISDFNTLCHVQPPLRSQQDQEALRQGVSEGIIDVICSDHQPLGIDSKLSPFAESTPGISGLETLLPLTMKLVNENIISLNRALQCLSLNPSKILNNQDTARLQIGKQANIILFDPDGSFELDTAKMHSFGKNTPFHGWSFQGCISQCIVNGHKL